MTQLEDAVKYHQRGDLKQAQSLYVSVLEKDPQNANALNLLGVLYLQNAKISQALECLKKAVSLKKSAPFLENLALAYFCARDYHNAAQNYKLALEIEKTFGALEQIVKCYEFASLYSEALKSCLIIYEDHPKNLDYIRKIAGLYKLTGDNQNALIFYKKCLEAEPEDYVALNNAGLVLENLYCQEDARVCYEKSLSIKNNYEAFHNLGVLHRRKRDFDSSIKYFHKALEIQPDNIETKISLGMSYLSKKDFENGYKYYSLRNPKLRSTYKNPWDGERHLDKTLLIHYDGGHGDQIMFCRYIEYLQEYFKEIKVLVYPSLLRLFKLNFPHLRVMLVSDDYHDYDYSVNVMEMHYHLKMDFENIPSSITYLKADEELVEKFKQEYFTNDKRKIGLFWQGNPNVFKNRSIMLKQLMPLFALENTQFYSFQKDEGLRQIDDFPQIINLDGAINDFSDTAAALMSLDVLITIDSAIAHLSAALGKKTVLLLPYASEWRWFDETKKTQWYPTIEIFKQSKPQDWESVVDEVLKALS